MNLIYFFVSLSVCRKWREASKWAWHNVRKLRFFYGNITFHIRSNLLNRCKHHLTSLSLHMIMDFSIENQINECYNLVDLHISSIDLGKRHKVGLFKNLKKLKNLHLGLRVYFGKQRDRNFRFLDCLPLGIERFSASSGKHYKSKFYLNQYISTYYVKMIS